MDVSVIIPTYNRRKLLSYTLSCLAPELHPGVKLEIIVIDDGSSDDTLEYVKANYPYVLILPNIRKGAPAARNYALSIAKGTYIHYLDSDDLVEEGFYASKVSWLNKEISYDACYGLYEYFESDTGEYKDQIVPKYKYTINSTLPVNGHLLNYLSGSYLPCNTIVWRKEILQRCNGQDETLSVNQDVDLFFRAIMNGMQITQIDDNRLALVRHHELDNRVGVIGRTNTKTEHILNLRKKIYASLVENKYNDPVYYKALSKFLFDFWRIARHDQPQIASQFLAFSRQVYWPVEIHGNLFFRVVKKVFGPVAAIKVKYLLTKRDF